MVKTGPYSWYSLQDRTPNILSQYQPCRTFIIIAEGNYPLLPTIDVAEIRVSQEFVSIKGNIIGPPVDLFVFHVTMSVTTKCLNDHQEPYNFWFIMGIIILIVY